MAAVAAWARGQSDAFVCATVTTEANCDIRMSKSTAKCYGKVRWVEWGGGALRDVDRKLRWETGREGGAPECEVQSHSAGAYGGRGGRNEGGQITQVRVVGRGGRNEGGQITQVCVCGGSRCCCPAGSRVPTPSPLIQRRSQRCGSSRGGGGTGEDEHRDRGRRHCWPSPINGEGGRVVMA